MADIRFELPRVVTLPADLIAHHHEIQIALAGPSKQLLRLWRIQRQFPKSYRDGNSSFVVTAELEKWLIAQGCEVRRI